MKIIVQEMNKGTIQTYGTEFNEVKKLLEDITTNILHQIPINITYAN